MRGDKRARVCVTAASGFIGSSLVKKLLQKGYVVHATCRDPGNPAKINHLVSLEGAKERLFLFKADLFQPGSFDSAIQGCDFVINLATSLDYETDPETGFIRPTIEGTLDILRACKDAKTVRRVVHASSISAASPLNDHGEFRDCLDESCWTPVDYIKTTKPTFWMYYAAKTLVEQAALQYGEDHLIEVVTVAVALVGGPSLAPTFPMSALEILTPITGNRVCYEALVSLQWLQGSLPLVHVEDVGDAHVVLMEQPNAAAGRYVCCSQALTMRELADFFCNRYPQIPVSSEYKVDDEKKTAVPISSKKLTDLGFSYKYGMEEIVEDSFNCAVAMQVL